MPKFSKTEICIGVLSMIVSEWSVEQMEKAALQGGDINKAKLAVQNASHALLHIELIVKASV